MPGVLHHVTQRGNNQQKIFLNERDFEIYCGLINDYASKLGVSILGYCLMTNHVHFVVKPNDEDALARFFSIVHMRYAQYFNKENNRKGHLWQGRFFSCFMDWPYVYQALRYIENNPVRAQMIQNAWEYPYSSAAAHVGQGKSFIEMEKVFEMSAVEWKEYLRERDALMTDEMRYKTRRGLGIGDEDFLDKAQMATGRVLVKRARGLK